MYKQCTPAITKIYPQNNPTPAFLTPKSTKTLPKFPQTPKHTKIPLKLPVVKMLRASRANHPAPCLPATRGLSSKHTPATPPPPPSLHRVPALALAVVSRSATLPALHHPTPATALHLPRAYALAPARTSSPVEPPPARTHIRAYTRAPALVLFTLPHARASRTHPPP